MKYLWSPKSKVQLCSVDSVGNCSALLHFFAASPYDRTCTDLHPWFRRKAKDFWLLAFSHFIAIFVMRLWFPRKHIWPPSSGQLFWNSSSLDSWTRSVRLIPVTRKWRRFAFTTGISSCSQDADCSGDSDEISWMWNAITCIPVIHILLFTIM